MAHRALPMSPQLTGLTMPSSPWPPRATSYDVPADTNKDGYVTQEEVYEAFALIREDYPHESHWDENTMYKGKTACTAWAVYCWDTIWGDYPIMAVSYAGEGQDDIGHIETAEDIKAGDYIINWDWNHAWMVVEIVEENGYRYAYTSQGNYSDSIMWGSLWKLDDTVIANIASSRLDITGTDLVDYSDGIRSLKDMYLDNFARGFTN